ncbi:MAG: hypothetical protein U1D55_00245 [Phycisphaerae bacterium]
MITVKHKLTFVRRPDRTQAIVVAHDPVRRPLPAGRLPRITRLMGLAIHFERLIRAGQVTDLSELARLAHVTQPRMTQIMNLNLLAPAIQEQLLNLPAVTAGRDPISERDLRPIAALVDWTTQLRRWQALQRAARLPE